MTLKGRPPFCLAGIETFKRLQELTTLTNDLVSHRHDPRLLSLSQGLEVALTQCASDYRHLNQGAKWLNHTASLLTPAADNSSDSKGVANKLRSYLDELLTLPGLPPLLDSFRQHLNKVSSSYWPGLFHCYKLEALPRTNNDLESHFRDSKRRLLRTTGQRGQTRRALQRTGAWELLPRPSSEAQSITALLHVSPHELKKEQLRFRKHRQRFRLHTRSTRRANAQLNRLRQQWLALSSTSSG